jgi:NADH-ubiquinone oxidoreductase chain 5
MYLLAVFLSLFSFCLSGLFGKQIGRLGSIRLSLFCIFFSFIISLFMLLEVGFYKSPVYVELFYWFNSETLNIKWSFLFDSLTIVMCVVVSFISFLVHLYSVEYMSNDPHLSRFLAYLSLFTFFMLILVTGDNFLQLFVGWEGVGLCSYLLINFWFTRIQANKAAIKAMILNRIGDFSLVIGILLIFVNFKTVDFSTLSILITFFDSSTIFSYNLINIIGFFLFVGAMGKSAQIGLHTWLPDAMEGPTPVSALIHAATMVTAGIFLIIRISFLYEYNFKTLEMITFVGVLTSFIASSTGLVQNDLKKVIAYSTCSQLGYMVFSCGLSNYSISLFHLLNHAFFKALLFLSAGSIIHSVSDEQDMRKMGGLRFLLPFSYTMILIGSLALIGFPFLTGFYSKDLILEVAFSKYNNFGFFSYFFGSLGAFFSSFYSTRLIFLTFLSKPNGFKKILCYSKDSGAIIKVVLATLSIPSIFIGFYSKEFLVGIGSSFFFNSIFFTNSNFVVFDAEFVITVYKLVPVILSLFGFIIALLFYFLWSPILYKIKTYNLGKLVYNFLNRKWYFDKIYNDYLGQFFFKVGYSASYKFLDRGIFEIIGPTGISFISINLSSKIHKFQTNQLYHTLLSIIIGATVLLLLKFKTLG